MSARRAPTNILILITLLILTLACSMPSFASQPEGLQDTQVAIGVQQTSLALQQATLNANQSQAAAADLAPTGMPLPTLTLTPAPSQPVEIPSPTSTVTQSNISIPPGSMEDQIQAANVLIFEDVWGHPTLSGDKRVSDAIDRIGFEGGKVINTGDAMGNFKSQLLSGTSWDLIIVSAEVRTSIQGEFWDYIMDQLNNKVAFIAEVWYLDDTASGRVASFLGACGIHFQRDWLRETNYNELDYSILNLVTDHPIFTTPNSGITLVTPNIYWMGDAGDLVSLGAGGDAEILAGTHFDRKTDYGLIAECMQGRVILQTFSTHDYRYDQTVPLWQNYIIYTLSNHFTAINAE
jgi:hypothetical protein